MARRICLLIAIASGLCGAILLAASPTVEVDGETVACGAVIAAWESGADDTGPCADKRQQWEVLAGLAALVCAGAGSYVKLGGRDERLPPRHVRLGGPGRRARAASARSRAVPDADRPRPGVRRRVRALAAAT